VLAVVKLLLIIMLVEVHFEL